MAILQEGLLLQQRLQSLAQQESRQQRCLEFQYKQWRSQLIGQIFFQLPSLSRPRVHILPQVREEYDSLCNQVAAEFANKILTEFDPYLGQATDNLTSKLTIWVNSKLRLKWQILDLITPKKKTQEIRLLELINTLVRRSPMGFTKADFLAAVQQQGLKINPTTATEYLLELVPRFWCAPPDGDRYFLDASLLQHHLDSLCDAIYITPLGTELAEAIPDLRHIPQVQTGPSFATKIKQLLLQYRAKLETICLKDNPHCHCFLLLENYFLENLTGTPINDAVIVENLGVKRPTYQAHLERKCLPAFWEFAIETSPVSQVNPQTKKNLLKEYIETDPQAWLKQCYYSDHQQQVYRDCHCQNLAKKILPIFVPKPEKWKNLAQCYHLTVDTLTRFWKMKCLFLLSLVVFELEAEYTDRLELDG